jgi:hypothetical protein
MKRTLLLFLLVTSAAFADPSDQQIVQLKFDAKRSIRLLNLLAEQNNTSGNALIRDNNNPQIAGLVTRLNRMADTCADWAKYDKELRELQYAIEDAVRQPIRH